ncbi:MAG: hypothetical protein EOP87_09910 [Verrucomicrobiaceae bacterium]|nr:MAG: hypothetical protein EOP87_09910 [Verrucomicrobiaceae bacterium]
MSVKNKKQFGVWLDNHHATIVGHGAESAGEFSVLGQVKNPGAAGNSNENAAQNHERALLRRYFDEITSHMPNADEIHATGTGTIQEQFIHHLAETPQFKNTVATESTTTKMSDEALVSHITSQFS